MAMFSGAVKASVARTSVYLATAAGVVGMVSNSQYKTLKSLFDNTPGGLGPPLAVSPFEHAASSAPVVTRASHRQTKFIATSEHGPHNSRRTRPRSTAPYSHSHVGRGRSQPKPPHHRSRRGQPTGESSRHSVFPRHGVL
ncbi:hypothetical protein DRE_03975 [Drechslerella stenobrocha 248]|uniref:Uncharacterized protein n=1 Tax=Drechslerella stenobrocha 248 TaxID=1043628 RepID=W7ICA3_9PEZI|nr:hypothetical protein DRE_03975 [Drechslerella stenobrocha 248]